MTLLDFKKTFLLIEPSVDGLYLVKFLRRSNAEYVLVRPSSAIDKIMNPREVNNEYTLKQAYQALYNTCKSELENK